MDEESFIQQREATADSGPLSPEFKGWDSRSESAFFWDLGKESQNLEYHLQFLEFHNWKGPWNSPRPLSLRLLIQKLRPRESKARPGQIWDSSPGLESARPRNVRKSQFLTLAGGVFKGREAKSGLCYPQAWPRVQEVGP